MKILLAEDNEVTRKVVEKHLVRWGYEVIALEDGNAAWECLQQPDAPHLLLLDWMMPGLSGIEVCPPRAKLGAGLPEAHHSHYGTQ